MIIFRDTHTNTQTLDHNIYIVVITLASDPLSAICNNYIILIISIMVIIIIILLIIILIITLNIN